MPRCAKSQLFSSLAIIALCAALPAAAQQPCTAPGALDRTISAAEVETVRIETGTGLLRLHGLSGIDEIRITARACADEPDAVDSIGYRTEVAGDTLLIADRLPEGANHPEAQFARMDLQLEVPARIHVEIVTRKEPVSVANVASLSLQSWRGETVVDGVVGNAKVVKQRGDLTIRNIGGSLTVSRQTGEMIVEKVGGDVIVERAERGNSRIQSVQGDVRFLSNGRGDVAVSEVVGDFTVDSNLAGRIHHSEVGGTVRIAEPEGLTDDQQPLDNTLDNRD